MPRSIVLPRSRSSTVRRKALQPAIQLDRSLQTTTTERFERRLHTRFPISATAVLTKPKVGAQMIGGLATDFGAGGCYIARSNTLSKGTRVEVFLCCERQTLHRHALVAYVVTGTGIGMGLAFTEAVPDDWVRRLVPNGKQGVAW
jgi:hypothetical protein